MTVLRMDNVLLVVDDLEAAVAFFAAIGLEREGAAIVEGPSVDRLLDLDGVRSEIVMMRTPDGQGIKLDKFHTPAAVRAEPEDAPVTPLGIRRIMFAVDDIDAVLARLRRHGGKLIGEVVQYGDSYRLCYARGPEGIMVGLCRGARVSALSTAISTFSTRRSRGLACDLPRDVRSLRKQPHQESPTNDRLRSRRLRERPHRGHACPRRRGHDRPAQGASSAGHDVPRREDRRAPPLDPHLASRRRRLRRRRHRRWLAHDAGMGPQRSREPGGHDRGRTYQATARVVVGPERDRLWEEHVAQLPWFNEYPSKTDRRFPMVRLTPVAA